MSLYISPNSDIPISDFATDIAAAAWDIRFSVSFLESDLNLLKKFLWIFTIMFYTNVIILMLFLSLLMVLSVIILQLNQSNFLH